ncbi:MAG: hypothetical protein DMF96_22295 [Acidobacteria bacterium]|nr:MAG: hypothetical protein DMF96_22295 [Acidobacteriota bacterium]
MRSLDRALDGAAAVYVASAASVIIACVFIFVWAPHPWGWEGFDHYHDLGRLLARGEPFPTTDVPWGYAYFLAPFYRVFGDRPWIPLLAQAALNGLVPILLYRLVSLELDRRTGAAAAILTGFFSFNTLYASTQSSDAVCTVVFVAALLLFAEGRTRGGLLCFAGSGALFGLAPQFRPNLVMLPPALAGLYLLARPAKRAKIAQALVYLAAAAVMLAPWTVRNYRLIDLLLPTSTHGGMQLWYGTLQAGPYLESRVYNPRSAFEFSGFDYSSVAGRPLLVSAEVSSCAPSPASIELVYWTDRHREPVRLPANRPQGGAARRCRARAGRRIASARHPFHQRRAPDGPRPAWRPARYLRRHANGPERRVERTAAPHRSNRSRRGRPGDRARSAPCRRHPRAISARRVGTGRSGRGVSH